MIFVKGPAGRTAHLFILEMRRTQTESRVKHAEVEAELVEALMKQFRHRGGRTVKRVLHRDAPPCRAGDTPREPLLLRQLVPSERALNTAAVYVAVDDLRASDFLENVQESGKELDRMPVRVDDRMVQAGSNLRGTRLFH